MFDGSAGGILAIVGIDARTQGMKVSMTVAALLLGGAGCVYDEGGGTPVITGVLQRDAEVAQSKSFVLMRAVPDHPDGFEVSRDYRGERFLEDGCPTQHLEFPFPYVLYGDPDAVDGADHVRWRLLVWETDDPEATWVQPGDVYGTTAFGFRRDAYGSYATEVDVVIDRVAQ